MIASDLNCPECAEALVLSERASRRTGRLLYDCRICSRRYSYLSRSGSLQEEEKVEESGPRTVKITVGAAGEQERPREFHPPTGRSAMPRGLSLILEVTDGPQRGKAFPVERARSVIGREEGEIVLGADPLISRRHAVFEIFDAETIILRDLASTNGTYHNGRLIDHCKIHDGDELQLGSTILSVQIEVARSA